jgi:hypothetical protein
MRVETGFTGGSTKLFSLSPKGAGTFRFLDSTADETVARAFCFFLAAQKEEINSLMI